MENEKDLETLENDIKLMKGQLKQTIAGVRDYLLNMELPSSEFATVLAALGSDGEQKITMKGSFSDGKDSGLGSSATEGTEEPATDGAYGESEEELEEPYDESPEPESEEPYDESLEPESEEPYDESLEPESELPEEEEDLIGPDGSPRGGAGTSPEDGMMDEYEDVGPEDELFSNEEEGETGETGETTEDDEQEALLIPESELAEEEGEPMEYGSITAEASQSTPKVNLLANLTNWVAKAKKEIGYEQLPTFLEVYGISGHLSPELKEVILHLSDITLERPEDTSTAEIWSQSMLSLHGILTGGNAPRYPLKPAWNDGASEIQSEEEEEVETEVEKVKEMPMKLKLVFPNGGGKGKEYCINLTPEADDESSEDKPKN